MKQTLFEQAGIEYREVDGLRYPILPADTMKAAADVGKYGRMWMQLLYELDCMEYHKMLMDGTLMDAAVNKNEYCYWILDAKTNAYLKRLGPAEKRTAMDVWKGRLVAQISAEEEICVFIRTGIEKRKVNRFSKSQQQNIETE